MSHDVPPITTTGGSTDELLRALRDPTFYPDRPDRVDMRETHISWVFLAGNLAYKVKKPIRLPFLDYSSQERRHHFCREEVRLNRRLAPRLYLGVRSIVRRDGRLVLGSAQEADPLEYAVEMRRFDEELTLAKIVARHEATASLVEGIGGRLADFHRSAQLTRLSFREAWRALRATVDETFQTLLDVRGDDLPSSEVARAGRFCEGFLAARRDALGERFEAGLWRDGHGDLRAEHIVLESGIEGIDCVEFDPALRQIDVSFDLAFLVMELEALGERDLAEALIRGYRSAGGDPGDHSLVSFYAALRAWIRSKVLLVRAGQLEGRGAAQASAASEAVDLFALGLARAWRARLPLALIVCGPPASGKTHLARVLSERSGLTILNSDRVRKELAGIPVTDRASDQYYAEGFTARTYAELSRRAVEAVEQEGGVIVDATFRRAEARQALVGGLAATGAQVLFVECAAPAAALAERARRRSDESADVSDATAEVAEKLRQEFEPLDEVGPRSHVTVRTDRPAREVIRDVEQAADRRVFG